MAKKSKYVSQIQYGGPDVVPKDAKGKPIRQLPKEYQPENLFDKAYKELLNRKNPKHSKLLPIGNVAYVEERDPKILNPPPLNLIRKNSTPKKTTLKTMAMLNKAAQDIFKGR